MKRIGVTTEGAALIEVSPEECAVLLRAASLLQGMDFMIRTVRAASPAEWRCVTTCMKQPGSQG